MNTEMDGEDKQYEEDVYELLSHVQSFCKKYDSQYSMQIHNNDSRFMHVSPFMDSRVMHDHIMRYAELCNSLVSIERLDLIGQQMLVCKNNHEGYDKLVVGGIYTSDGMEFDNSKNCWMVQINGLEDKVPLSIFDNYNVNMRNRRN